MREQEEVVDVLHVSVPELRSDNEYKTGRQNNASEQPPWSEEAH
jgi:hypothetical protein